MHSSATADERPTRRMLIAGYGRLGSQVSARLVARGWRVQGLRRGSSSEQGGVDVRSIDLAAEESCGSPTTPQLPAADALVITLPPPRSVDGTVAPDAYRRPLDRLASMLPRTPGRVVFVSSTRVFEGRSGDGILTEADAPAPLGDRAQALFDGERHAVELFAATVLRPSGIYGPGRESIVRRVLARDAFDYERRTNRIHEVDLARAIEAVIDAPTPPPLLHVSDALPAPLGDVVEHVAELLGVPPPPRLPAAQPSGTVLSGELLRTLLGELTFPSYREGYAALVRSGAR